MTHFYIYLPPVNRIPVFSSIFHTIPFFRKIFNPKSMKEKNRWITKKHTPQTQRFDDFYGNFVRLNVNRYRYT